MQLRNGKVLEYFPKNTCKHSCECKSSGYCCECSDKRPHSHQYIVLNKPRIDDFSLVKRNHSYCPTCKRRDGPKEKPKTLSYPELLEKVKTLEYLLQQRDETIASLHQDRLRLYNIIHKRETELMDYKKSHP